jgi:membrane-associated protease RseP (regulator of RpoE activity)
MVMQMGQRVVTSTMTVWALGALLHAQEPLPRSALPVELVGVVVDARVPSRSGCLVRCMYPEELRRTAIVEVGRTACDLAEIREVHEDAVVIRNVLTNRTELLAFRGPGTAVSVPVKAAAAPPPVPRIVTASPARVDVEVQKGTVDRYLADLPGFLSSALATPRYRSNGGLPGIDGFEISQVKAGGAVDVLGLRDGDVILEFNGERLDSLATVLRLFGQAQSGTSATLTVLRNGQPLTFTFKTK